MFHFRIVAIPAVDVGVLLSSHTPATPFNSEKFRVGDIVQGLEGEKDLV